VGIPGVLAAALGARAVLTDLEDVVEGTTEANVRHNAHLWGVAPASAATPSDGTRPEGPQPRKKGAAPPSSSAATSDSCSEVPPMLLPSEQQANGKGATLATGACTDGVPSMATSDAAASMSTGESAAAVSTRAEEAGHGSCEAVPLRWGHEADELVVRGAQQDLNAVLPWVPQSLKRPSLCNKLAGVRCARHSNAGAGADDGAVRPHHLRRLLLLRRRGGSDPSGRPNGTCEVRPASALVSEATRGRLDPHQRRSSS